MTDFPHISLEQWRALQAVVDAGGYAQAAEALHKSQSAVTYAVQKIETQLDVKLFNLQGRKAVLTEAGHLLYRRARTLIEEALALERGVESLREGWKPELRIAMEIIFPVPVMLDALRIYAVERPDTHVELYETVMGGTHEMLTTGQVDIAICSSLPKGFIGDTLVAMRFIAATHPDHPLHALNRPLTQRDLRRHRHLYIRDTGSQRTRDPVFGGADDEQRWTVSDKATSIRAACMGLGYAWYAEEDIRAELASGQLKPLPLREGAERYAELYLVYADRDYAGRDEVRLGELIRERVAACPSAADTASSSSKAGGKVSSATDRKTAQRARRT